MPKYGLVFPVVSGKEPLVREVSQQMKQRRSEFEESRGAAGISIERAYLQTNPDGSSLVVAYVEGQRSFADTMKTLLESNRPIDRYFIDKNSEATGVDFRSMPPGSEPELVGEWAASGGGARQRGFAFAAPLQPGKTEAARQFAHEAYVTRREELADSRRGQGLIREEVFLNQTTMGDLVVVYLEGQDPVEGNRRFAASNSHFDRWFKDRCKDIFPEFIDFNQPVPANEELLSSV